MDEIKSHWVNIGVAFKCFDNRPPGPVVGVVGVKVVGQIGGSVSVSIEEVLVAGLKIK